MQGHISLIFTRRIILTVLWQERLQKATRSAMWLPSRLPRFTGISPLSHSASRKSITRQTDWLDGNQEKVRRGTAGTLRHPDRHSLRPGADLNIKTPDRKLSGVFLSAAGESGYRKVKLRMMTQPSGKRGNEFSLASISQLSCRCGTHSPGSRNPVYSYNNFQPLG